jgi:ephrin receptor-like protein
MNKLDEAVRDSASAQAGAPEGTIDMTGRSCRRCGRGTYQEIWQFDDRDGDLHCTSCALGVRHYEPTGANVGSCVSCDREARQEVPPFRDGDLFCRGCARLEGRRGRIGRA